MKLYAVTMHRPNEDPCESRVHKHLESKQDAAFEAFCLNNRNGWKAIVTVVDVGDPKDALLSLINDPNWLNEQPRTVVK